MVRPRAALPDEVDVRRAGGQLGENDGTAERQFGAVSVEPQDRAESVIDGPHLVGCEMAHAPAEAPHVDGDDLLDEHPRLDPGLRPRPRGRRAEA